jgi:hypothetical protein
MTASREDVFNALFAIGSQALWTSPYTGGSFIEASRKVKLFSDVPAQQQPAFFQAEHNEEIAQKTNLPYRQQWDAQWVIYQCVGKTSSSLGATENNLILDSLVAAMRPSTGDPGYPQRNTLGRLVYHAYITGRVFKDPGDIDQQGMMTVPIRILVP